MPKSWFDNSLKMEWLLTNEQGSLIPYVLVRSHLSHHLPRSLQSYPRKQPGYPNGPTAVAWRHLAS